MSNISRRKFIPLVGTAILGASCISVIDNSVSSGPMIKPKRLKKGSLIGIATPAGASSGQNEVDEFTSKLKELGFNVKVGKNASSRYGYFSADDQERADEFMDMINDPEIEAIFFTRGGWGCNRILPFLDFDQIKKNPKIIMGFSDITTLLNVITAKTGLITFHGPGGNSTWNDFSWKHIKSQLLDGQNTRIEHNQISGQEKRTIVSGMATAEVYGGNLTVLCSMIGSDYFPNLKNKILFLEDVLEEPYRIDRMLTQLKLAGVLNELSGVVLGSFRKCEPEFPEKSFTLDEVFDQHFKNASYPVCLGVPVGHILYKQTVPVGLNATLNSDECSLVFNESGVI